MATDAERYNAGTVRYPVTDGVMEVEIAANGAMIFIGSKGEQMAIMVRVPGL